MLLRLIFLIALLLSIFWPSKEIFAQTAVSGWDPLPDSLHTIWKLDQDQVRRLRMIEEDHEAERVVILADKSMSSDLRDQRLKELASSRKNEIKAVLQVKQYEDWERRCRAAAE